MFAAIERWLLRLLLLAALALGVRFGLPSATHWLLGQRDELTLGRALEGRA